VPEIRSPARDVCDFYIGTVGTRRCPGVSVAVIRQRQDQGNRSNLAEHA
jgi:hypothetical protein